MPTVVQQKSVGSGTSVTFDSATTAGNSIIVLARAYGSTDLGTGDITDNKSNTYTRRVVHSASQGVTTKAAVYDCQSPTMGSSHTVSISSHTDQGITAIEVSGLTGSPAFDKSGGAGPSSTTTPATSSTGTLTQADELVVATICTDQGNTDTVTQSAGQGWSLLEENEDGTTLLVFNSVYKVVAATTALTADWTLGGTHTESCVIATYKITAPGSNPPAGNAAVTVTANQPTITRTDPYVVSSIGAALSTNDPSVTFSGYTPLENDVIAFFISSTTVLDVAANASLPSGWVNPLGDGVEINSDAHGMACVYHLVTAAEQTAVTLTYTATDALQAAETGYVQAVAVRNCNPSAPIDGFNTAQDSSNTVTPHVLAGITGSGVLLDGSLVVSSVAKDATGDYGASAPAGWTRLRNDNTNNGRWIGYRDTQTTLDTDVAATNITPSAGDEYCSITLAFARATNAVNVNVPAAAAVTVTANATNNDVRPTSGSAAVTVTAPAPAISRQAIAGNAAVTVTGNNASTDVRPTAGLGAVTVTGNNPGADIRPPVGSAAVTVTANNATPSTTTNVNVDAGSAAVAVTANNASTDVKVSAGVATVTVAGNQATPSVAPSASTATVTALANNPAHDVRPGSGYALIAVAANNATIPGVVFFVTDVDTSGRFLIDQNSDPIFVQGNSPQILCSILTSAEMATFFADQSARGINAAQIHLCANELIAANSGSVNVNGDPPFANMATFGSPDADYWALVDTMFDHAETYGITVFASPVDNISYAGTWGSISDANAFAYGQFLGARYKDRPNIVWSFGNDWQPGQWSALQGKYAQCYDGIRDQGDTHLVTVWLNYTDSISTDLVDTGGYSAWNARIDVQYAYSYTLPYYQIELAYGRGGTGDPRPVIGAEWNYDGEHNHPEFGESSTTDETIRRSNWWTVTWGGCGNFFGQAGIWNCTQFTNSAVLNSSAAQENALVAALLTSFDNWQLLEPDTDHSLLTAGAGTHNTAEDTDPLDNNYATMAVSSDGLLAIGYFPDSRSITLDTSEMQGTVTGYWYDPTDGSTTVDNPPVTHPGTNSAGQSDWVLVLEGTPATTAPAGSAPVTVTGNNAAAAVALPAGNAAGTVTANAASGAVAPSAGNAPVAVTANSPAVSVAVSAGVATVTVTGNDATISTDTNVSVSAGVATVTVTANDTGHAVTAAVGNATVAVDANGATLALMPSAGSASVTVAANVAAVAVAASAVVAAVLAAANNAAVDNGEGVETLMPVVKVQRPNVVKVSRPGVVQLRKR